MSDTVSETMARRIFELAVETGQSGKLLDLLFDGGSVTVDAQTGKLVMIPGDALAEMANAEPPEWCTCREPDKPLGIAKFHRRRVFHPGIGGEWVELRVYDGQENLHIDGEYAVYRRTAVVTEPGVELEAIVRDLADHGSPRNGFACAYCGSKGDHDGGCLWLRAKRWVSAHPVSGDQQ